MNVLMMHTLVRCFCAGIGAYAATWIVQWCGLAWRRDDAVDGQAQLVERVHPVVSLTLVIAWWQAGAWQPAFAPILPGIDGSVAHGSGLDADAILRGVDDGLQRIVRLAWPILLVHTGVMLPATWLGRGSAGSGGARRLIWLGAIPALWAAAPVYCAWAIDGVAASLRATAGVP